MTPRRPIACLAFAVAALVLLAASGPAPGSAGPGLVPSEYADLYATLDAGLKSIGGYLAARWNGEKHEVVFSAELLAANSNQGESLLRGAAWQAVILSLDSLQTLGIRGVKVAVKYPILVPSFPRSDDYLEFYRRLGEEVRRRNLKLLVQMTPAFRNPVFSSIPVAGYYAGLTLERYTQEKRQMAQAVIREIRPDSLTIENEPGTAHENTGLPFTVQTMTDVVRGTLRGLDRSGVRIGAGAGTWDDPAYVESLAQHTTLDYLDMHIYPIGRDYVVDRAMRIAAAARRSGKGLVLGEAWLYKARDRELSGQPVAAAAALFGRDVYRFWEPLDIEFLTAMVRLSHYLKIDMTSFFWSRYFFGYIDYDETTRRLAPAELFRLANREAAGNMLATPPRLTNTGLALKNLLKSSP
jgi:hypothetical protein